MLDAIALKECVAFSHVDTKGIVNRRALQYLHYHFPTNGRARLRYVENDDIWRGWGERLRAHAKAKGIRLEDYARQFPARRSTNEGDTLSESGLRHWINGRTRILLQDFFKLCTLAGADPQRILFGDERGAVNENAVADRIVERLEERGLTTSAHLPLSTKSPLHQRKLPQKSRHK